MSILDLRSQVAALRRAQEEAFSAETNLRAFCRVHAPTEIVGSPELQAEFDELTERVSQRADEFEARAAKLVAARDFLNDLLNHFLLADTPPPERPDRYADWLHAVDRVMGCRARFPLLDEAIVVRQEDSVELLQEDRALADVYREALLEEAHLFESVTGITVIDEAEE